MFPESGANNTPAGSPAPGTEGGSSADLSSSLSQSIEDVSQDMVGCWAPLAHVMDGFTLPVKLRYERMSLLSLQASVLLLILSGTACTVEVKGEDQVVAVEAQNLSPVQMGNIRVSDLLSGLTQGNLD